MTKEEAIKATRNGAVAACISAGITLLVVIIAIALDTSDKKLAIWNNPWNLLDVILILVCAYGMFKKSRIAAILIFVYFIAAKIVIAIDTGQMTGSGLGALVFLYFYAKAIQGAFVFHKLEKQDNPNYKSGISKWAYLIIIPFILCVVIMVGFALMSSIGIIPSTRVLATNEIPASDMDTLRSKGIISADDHVKYFFAQGLSSILESGNILTENRVIFYQTDENNQIKIYEVFLSEITDVTLETEGGAASFSVYKVNTQTPDRWIRLFLSTEQKGDQQFVQAIRNTIKKQN